MTGWVDHAVWWHVYPLGFTGAPGSAPAPGEPPVPRLGALEPWLDYAVELGCSGLALGPVFASSTHGYDTVDHYRVDPRLGTGADFDRLVAAARSRGLRVLLDGVFNHVGRAFPRFAEAVERGPGSEAARWFRHVPGGGPADYEVFEGHHALPLLDHAEPGVGDHVADVMGHWLDRGASGWRLDAAYAVPPRFWRSVLPRVRARHPDAWFVGEVIHGDYAGYAADSTLDSLTQYELWKALRGSVEDANLFELAWALKRHNAFTEAFTPLTFAGNHDVTRLASALTDTRHIGHVLAVLFSVAGVPAVYYGDEQAYRGVKEEREGGDDDVRPAFPAGPGELAPWGAEVFRTHRDLIGMRRRNPWLVRARTEVLHLDNRAMALRCAADGPAGPVMVLLNLDDAPVRFPLDGPLPPVAVRGGGPAAADPREVPGHGWTVLSPD
ncbi:alpha-amylase family protein [Actinorugispora endophytica]|uniref:Glycosidase n=1 Tax=Actinorugispora endophytica TaxID=1605990 RepID=A0A4R6V201_9ACTN|nr:alpha-amylase family protein [Actinorugispora endophytica]TDQ54174.1 glycosidase [Actinorugispora endophytica]